MLYITSLLNLTVKRCYCHFLLDISCICAILFSFLFFLSHLFESASRAGKRLSWEKVFFLQGGGEKEEMPWHHFCFHNKINLFRNLDYTANTSGQRNTSTTHRQRDLAFSSHTVSFSALPLAFLSFGCTLKWHKTEYKAGPECLSTWIAWF